MLAEEKIHLIHQIARKNATDREGRFILWSRHAIIELVSEGWQRLPIEIGLQQCEIVEDYPALHRPLPDCLVLGWLHKDEPFHAVVAIDQERERLLIVTVYRPSLEEWKNDWKHRC